MRQQWIAHNTEPTIDRATLVAVDEDQLLGPDVARQGPTDRNHGGDVPRKTGLAGGDSEGQADGLLVWALHDGLSPLLHEGRDGNENHLVGNLC